MKKTNTFFIIHNFNTVPENLLKYCNDYMIYDASTDEKVKQELKEKNLKHISIANTGHNITTYFQYFADNYECLPNVMALLKGNILTRHCSKEYFERVYDNQYFTYLFEEYANRSIYAKNMGEQGAENAFLVTESQFVEKNSDWYVESPNHPHRYFDRFDDLLTFIYKDPLLPKWCLFSPGACYIVRKEQVLKNSKEFYLNLNKIMNYDLNPNFPSEAHQIERMLPIILESAYEKNTWMEDLEEFDKKLFERIPIIERRDRWKGKRLKRIRMLFGENEENCK